MRAWIVAIALVAACKGGTDAKDKPAAPPAAKQALAVPKVATAAVLAADEKPPFLLLLDASGKLHVSAAASWADVATKDLMVGAKTADDDVLWRWMHASHGARKPPREALAAWDPKAEVALEDKPGSGAVVHEDPPPPEDDDPPPPEDDDPPPPEEADPDDLRRQLTGRRGTTLFAGISDSDRQGFGPGTGLPSRAVQVVGEVMEDGKLAPLVESAVIVSPATPAPRLVELVARFSAAIVVAHGATVRPLRIQFVAERDAGWQEPKSWLEARVTAKNVTLEAVPDVPLEVADLKELAGALDKARTARGVDKLAPVDVLVDPSLDAQRLVDVVAALDQAGVRMIGLGLLPSAAEMAMRGKRIPTTTPGQPNVQGDLDKALIRHVVKTNLDKVEACYTSALAKNPALAGTISVQFFITPKGRVAQATASGVDPAMATCVADAIKKLQFPEPTGGGGAQVVYPFTFRP